MAIRIHSSHSIVVHAPIDQAFMYFTPAGEELWVDGWQPVYVYPPDGATVEGMVFTTGEGDERTIWTLADFDRTGNRSRYVRCTPASRTSVVEVRCSALDAGRTSVQVSYTLTALNATGERVMQDFEGERFVAMIDEWADRIAKAREALLYVVIR
jgi:hypothetical protein